MGFTTPCILLPKTTKGIGTGDIAPAISRSLGGEESNGQVLPYVGPQVETNQMSSKTHAIVGVPKWGGSNGLHNVC